ncbi:MAG: cytochrome c oxidase assembly protein [Cellvibrionaceae bacterium]
MIKRFWQDNSTPVLCTKLGITVVSMFVFAIFIMPPLYDLFCDITGLNGKTADSAYQAEGINELGVDTSRTIKVQFIASNNENMPWEFRPTIKTVEVHPGEPTVIHYFAHNTTGKDMVAQAVPSLVPYKAATYFHKTECFCFNQQPLAAGETAELGLSFIVDLDIPKQVNTITLSYTLFDITDQKKSADKAEKKVTTLNNKKPPVALAVLQ